jgi:hypothetical protein
MTHAYAVPAVFSLIVDGVTHDLLMMRNPWG